MTESEQREAARQFINRWRGKGKEDEDGRSYWIELLSNVFGVENVTERIDFEKKVVVDGNTKRIDVYIPETRVIIEQKSLNIPLDKKIRNSGGIDLTPFDQADRYNSKLIFDERARWIVTCNFAEIWIYDMNEKQPKPSKIMLEELQTKYSLLDFLIKKEVQKISHEMEVSIKAGDIVGLLYNAFLEQYKIPEAKKNETEVEKEKREHKLKSLNALCVRLVFCLYAEDAGIFGEKHNMFHDYLARYEARDCRRALIELFKVLDTEEEDREDYLEEELADFPYVNGGLFADESVEIPQFTEEIRELLLTKASEDFNWRDISPTIFGAVFESTLNPETRRSGGMHYTSIENIHKVIDPLFLNDLWAEFNQIKDFKMESTRRKKYMDLQEKISKLKFLDPACGSGNFLTESYLSLRRLENGILKALYGEGQGVLLSAADDIIKVSIQQFYGIEINDFAVTVAKTALWIAEAQMLDATKDIIYGFEGKFLPLKTYVNVVEANALKINWNDVVQSNQLNYIMGNPPFVGARWMSVEQKKDVEKIFDGWKRIGDLDYVSCWYKKAADYIGYDPIQVALVSTNSITQGESVSILWAPLIASGIHIDFAYRTFIWDSEASIKAHVHCVIIGFSRVVNKFPKIIYSEGKEINAKNINGYLIDADDIYVEKRMRPLCDVPGIVLGGQAIDGGFFILTEEEKNLLLQREPQAKIFIRHYMMGKDFINRKPRYCIWLVGANPTLLKKCPLILDRVNKVQEFRNNSKRSNTKKAALTPTLFASVVECKNKYIAIPKVSSQNRRYIPMDYLSEEVIPGDKLFTMSDASLYHFGILNSNVHMAWMRVVGGRLKSDYSYSNTIIYNNFPWPEIKEEHKTQIEKTAQNILNVRAAYPDSSLADLYDPLTMPPELLKAHRLNNMAVMAAYGFSTKMTEADCVAELMKLYQKMILEEKMKKSDKKSKKK